MPAKPAKALALVTALGTMVTALVIGSQGNTLGVSTEFQMDFFPILGSTLHLGMDMLTLAMLLLNGLVFSLIFYYLHNRRLETSGPYVGLLLLLFAALNGVYLSYDLLWFYIFWELALLPIFIFVVRYSPAGNLRSFLKFFIYTIAGSLMMLAGILYLYAKGGSDVMDVMRIAKVALPLHVQSGVFFAFFIAFAVKIPIFPLHTWQPETYTSAAHPGTMALAGAMLKMALFGLIRWVLPICPDALAGDAGTVALFLTVFGVIYASLIAIRETNLKKMFAYASMAHVGVMTAGILSMQSTGINGAMLFMVAHGVNAVGLFILFDILESRLGTSAHAEMGGLRHHQPVFAGLYLVILLASIGLPLTNGFLGEFFSLSGLFATWPMAGAIATISVILGAVYMLRSYQAVFLGEHKNDISPLNFIEKSTLWIIVIIIFLLGLFPELVLQFSRPAVEQVLSMIQ